MEYWECPQQLADRCACGGALCTARRSPAIPYRRTAFFGQKLPIPPSTESSSTQSTAQTGGDPDTHHTCRRGAAILGTVCLDEERACVIVPCNHRVLCTSCAAGEQWDECPVCRAKCDSLTRVYGSYIWSPPLSGVVQNGVTKRGVSELRHPKQCLEGAST